jgi:hypothetical protein
MIQSQIYYSSEQVVPAARMRIEGFVRGDTRCHENQDDEVPAHTWQGLGGVSNHRTPLIPIKGGWGIARKL